MRGSTRSLRDDETIEAIEELHDDAEIIRNEWKQNPDNSQAWSLRAAAKIRRRTKKNLAERIACEMGNDLGAVRDDGDLERASLYAGYKRLFEELHNSGLLPADYETYLDEHVEDHEK